MERESWRMMKQMNSIKQVTLSLVVMLCFCGIESQGQQLRDAFRNVQQAVVIVRTEQKGLAPFPQEGLVSLNGLGSGVLISNDGKVLTAAHLVQSADRTMVEFGQGELIPATVSGSSLSADVALLQLEHCPAHYTPAKLGDSNEVDVVAILFHTIPLSPCLLQHINISGEGRARIVVVMLSPQMLISNRRFDY